MATSPQDLEAPRHAIGVVARRTGLKPDLIRAWERRYRAVSPARSDSRRRLYSDRDVRRLSLLRQAVDGGRMISQVAGLVDGELAALVAGDAAALARRGAPIEPATADDLPAPEALVEVCLAAVADLDARALERQIERASLLLPRERLITQVLAPLMERIGELWREGVLRPAQEHLAASVVRSFAGRFNSARGLPEGAPRVVVTTPAGQRHELGALLVAASVTAEGWEALYLGADLPAEEIAAAAHASGARAVALSITFPPDDPALPDELRRLGRLLPADVRLFAGGRSARAYAAALDDAGARRIDALDVLRGALADLRTP